MCESNGGKTNNYTLSQLEKYSKSKNSYEFYDHNDSYKHVLSDDDEEADDFDDELVVEMQDVIEINDANVCDVVFNLSLPLILSEFIQNHFTLSGNHKQQNENI